MERRLTAIFAADMVGYSRLIEANEVGTITRQKRHRAELIDPMIAQHGGSIIKLTGDGMIAEFPSVVEAVQCAVSVQREMEAREADVAEDRRIRYRVAINLGDVVFDDGDVYGDGVNIAARLEALADPGGVVVSGTAYDHLKSNVDVGYQDLGERQVKNIATPVRVYRVVPDGDAAPPPVQGKRRRPTIWGAAAAILIVVAIAVWEFAIRPDPVDETSFDRAALLAVPEGPTLAVLPFVNRSDDPEQDYFAEGISAEILSDMALYRELRLLGQNSTSAVVKETRDPRAIGEKLGADYVLDGYVRRAGERVRVLAQLFDAKSGTQVWSETFDKDLTVANLFDIQSKISESIAIAIGDEGGAINLAAKRSANRKQPKDLTAYECVLYSYGDWFRPGALKRNYECATEVVKADPQNAIAWTNLAWVHLIDAQFGFGITGLPREEAVNAAFEAAESAVKADPDYQLAIYWRARAYALKGDRERYRTELDRYLAMGWRSNLRMGWAGYFVAVNGRWDLGMDIVKKAISLSPGNYPTSWHYTFGDQHFINGEYDKALEQYRIAEVPGFWLSDVINAATHALRGDLKSAREAARQLEERRPGFTIEDAVIYFDGQARHPDYIQRYVEGLRIAGVPEGDYDGRFDG